MRTAFSEVGLKRLIWSACGLAVMLLNWSPVLAQSEKPDTVSVCDVLKNRATYQNRIIALRGRWITDREGSYLRSACSKEDLGLHRAWSAGVAIAWSLRAATTEISFEQDRSALHKVEKVLLKSRERGELGRVWITFVGKIETRHPLRVRTYSPGGGPLTLGFGHLGAFPAQLVVKTAKDLVIDPPLDLLPDG